MLVAAFFVGALLAPPTGDDPPWSATRWAALEPTLTAIALVSDGPTTRIELAFDRPEAVDPIVEVPHPGTLVVRWRCRPGDRPALPVAMAPISDWRLQRDAHDHRLVMQVDPRWPASVEQRPGGWHIVLGRSTATPAWVEPAAPRELWIEADPALWQAEDELHRAVREARAGEWGTALTRLAAMSDPSRPLLVQASASLIEGQLLVDAGLPLLAIEPLARATQLTPDASQAIRALRHLRAITGRDRRALAFALPQLRQTWRDDSQEAWWLALEVGRALLALGRPEDAANRLLVASRSPRSWSEARYLVHVAARLAGDDAAAEQHLRALAEALPMTSAVRVEVELARARQLYDRGELDAARARYRQLLAERPDVTRARVELGWLDLRTGQPISPADFVPFDLDVDGVELALLVGALYHQRCHPERAAAVAGVVIDRLGEDALLTRLEAELAATERARWAASRERLRARAERYRRQRGDARATRSAAFFRREALKLRFSADARRGDEVRTSWYTDGALTPEPPYEGWTGTIWVDTAAAALADRCAAMATDPPMARVDATTQPRASRRSPDATAP